jgi:glycosyltransferase involved in cell wall biosynthesis
MVPHNGHAELQARVLLVINALSDPARARAIQAGQSPRKDYLELQRMLGADLLDLGMLDRWRWTRMARALGGTALAQALLAWRWSSRYDVVFADRESTGFLLAALYRLLRNRPRLVVIGHMLSPRKKQLLVKFLQLWRTIDRLIVHSSLQLRIAHEALGFSEEKMIQLPYQADDRFWAPREAPMTAMICSAGLEFRDYATLVKAVAGLDIKVVIAAASQWSKHHGLGSDQPLPANVEVAAFDYHGLRELYAASQFVVVPLLDVENQAGITTILEAMAMGKAVIVSHTRGQTDVVRDRRSRSRTEPERSTQPAWSRSLGATDSTARGHTGIYVRPHDPAELRKAIMFLLEHPAHAREMGANGRRLIEETMNLDQFTMRITAIVREAYQSSLSPSLIREKVAEPTMLKANPE